jgi:hypothetical protein
MTRVLLLNSADFQLRVGICAALSARPRYLRSTGIGRRRMPLHRLTFGEVYRTLLHGEFSVWKTSHHATPYVWDGRDSNPHPGIPADTDRYRIVLSGKAIPSHIFPDRPC